MTSSYNYCKVDGFGYQVEIGDSGTETGYTLERG